MFEELSVSHSGTHTISRPGTGESGRNYDKSKKTKNIKKKSGRQRNEEDEEKIGESKQQLTKEEKKAIQKEKNRLAAQLSRDKQKKYVQDLELKVNNLEKMMSTQLCKKCAAQLIEHSTTEEENSMEEDHMGGSELPYQNNSSDLLRIQPEIEPLPFIRIPFEKTDLGFGKIGSFFCLSMLLFAVICLSGSVEEQGANVQERRLMQAVYDTCLTNPEIKKESQRGFESNVPSTLDYQRNWPFSSNLQDSSSSCKAEFWESYLNIAREEISSPTSKNLLNCNKPTLVRISNPQREDEANEQWTFLISDPTINHAHIEENGAFYIDEVNYLSGVYQMVAERVVLKKVVGQKCLA